jgi:uncharacterized membrane protein
VTTQPPNRQLPDPPFPPPRGKSQSANYVLEVGFTAGPIPPPEILRGYEEASAGAANRIITMAEDQGRHRREMEKLALEMHREAIKAQFTEARFGQCFAFTVSAISLVLGAVVVIEGHTVPGSLFGLMGLGGIVSSFIRGRSSEEKHVTPSTVEGEHKPKQPTKKEPRRR